jgi:ribonuclease HI
LCVDYRQLNKKIVKDRYPLPIIEEQLDSLQNAKFFSTLDLKNGFFHVKIDEQSKKYTAFIVPDGHYEFLRVPFGLCNSPAIFQRFINIAFKDLIQAKIVLTYMDDLIIPSSDYESGITNLKVVLRTACEAGLIINWRKCSFLKRQVEFLGHIIEDGRVYPSKRKIEAVQKFPEPSNVKQLQSFLGLSGYFRKFIPQYSIIARSLNDLLKANTKYVFGVKEREAFIQLKEKLSNKPVLNLYRISAETELHTDASIHGYGAILLQKSMSDNVFHPVYYSNSKTTTTKQKYSSYELEVLAIIKALKKFRIYLIGIPFTIVTDCSAFTATMNKKDLCVRVARWALALEEFNYKIEHRPGKNMYHVDALSRYPIAQCNIIEKQKDGLITRLKKAQESDSDVKKIFDRAKSNQVDDFVVKNSLLFKEVDGDLCVVVPKSMQSQIIRQAHERGHFSIAKTEALLRKNYWIPNVKAKIEKIIKNCVACILAEKKQGKQEGFLNPIEKEEVPLDTYHIDHIGPLPSTKKKL